MLGTALCMTCVCGKNNMGRLPNDERMLAIGWRDDDITDMSAPAEERRYNNVTMTILDGFFDLSGDFGSANVSDAVYRMLELANSTQCQWIDRYNAILRRDNKTEVTVINVTCVATQKPAYVYDKCEYVVLPPSGAKRRPNCTNDARSGNLIIS